MPPSFLRTLRRLAYSTMPVHPPSPRPIDWKYAAPSPPPGTTTFAAQSTLPKLPVLPLLPTLERLKRTLAPIAHSQAELAEAERKIDAFGSGIGPELQRRLEAHAQGKPHWLEEWWDDAAYLSYRDSVRQYPLSDVTFTLNVAIVRSWSTFRTIVRLSRRHPIYHVDPYHISVDGFASPPSTQRITGPRAARNRAASLTRAAMLYRHALKRGEVPAEGTKDTPLCMDTYRCVSQPVMLARL